VDKREQKRRLFAGVALDDGARQRSAGVSEALRKTGFDAKYEETEKLHATLAFLGNVEAARFDAVCAALKTSAAGHAPFSITLDKLGAFPHERKPRVVYIGTRDQGAAHRTLAQSVRAAYVELGFRFKEDPVAHVTIARVKESRRALPSIEFEPIGLRVAALTLFESIFDARANTSRYQIVAEAQLAVAGGST
jgi:RNA 2',3'-cyclic 3'-phosphodiesterase